MPILGKVSERANEKFNSNHIDSVSIEAVKSGQSLGKLAWDLGLATSRMERDYLDSWPAAIQEGIRAVLASAASRDPRVPVQITWHPGYDFAVQVWEAKGVGSSAAQITIHLSGPYPELSLFEGHDNS